mgnify:CR=1 FL=1
MDIGGNRRNFGSLLVMQGMTNTLLFVLISLSLIIIGKVSGKAFMRAVLLSALWSPFCSA